MDRVDLDQRRIHWEETLEVVCFRAPVLSALSLRHLGRRRRLLSGSPRHLARQLLHLPLDNQRSGNHRRRLGSRMCPSHHRRLGNKMCQRLGNRQQVQRLGSNHRPVSGSHKLRLLHCRKDRTIPLASHPHHLGNRCSVALAAFPHPPRQVLCLCVQDRTNPTHCFRGLQGLPQPLAQRTRLDRQRAQQMRHSEEISVRMRMLPRRSVCLLNSSFLRRSASEAEWHSGSQVRASGGAQEIPFF